MISVKQFVLSRISCSFGNCSIFWFALCLCSGRRWVFELVKSPVAWCHLCWLMWSTQDRIPNRMEAKLQKVWPVDQCTTWSRYWLVSISRQIHLYRHLVWCFNEFRRAIYLGLLQEYLKLLIVLVITDTYLEDIRLIWEGIMRTSMHWYIRQLQNLFKLFFWNYWWFLCRGDSPWAVF